ncbi:hypothetical protein G9A89_023681 [Geosiphon pyriformis]|nr:hypothetical protein G9A89_023681 [Geosiphon pyriformis]
MENCETWASKDQFRVLLFTLPVGTMAHNLRTLLDRTGGKTCVINRYLETGNRIYCAVIGFESDDDLESAFHTEPILGGVKLSWTRMNLVWCKKCGKFGHFAIEYDAPIVFPSKSLRIFKKIASDGCCLQLAKLYEKKSVSISHSTAFVSLASSFGGLRFSSGSSSSAPLSGVSDSDSGFPLTSANDSSLNAHLATLECSLELLTNQVSGILKKLGDMELILKATSSGVFSLTTPTSLVPFLDVDMVLEDKTLASAPYLSTANDVVHDSGLSFSKVLTSKVGRLELKIVAFEISISLVLERLNHLCSGAGFNVSAKQKDIVCWHKEFGNMVSIITETKLRSSSKSWIANKFESVCVFMFGLDKDFLGAGVTVIMNNSLACHVSKVKEIPGQVISVQLSFKGKLSVTILDLYAGVSSETRFAQALKVNSIIAEAINSSTFMVLGGNFNENGSKRNVTFKFCLNLGLYNSWGIKKTINFIFIGSNFSSAIAGHRICSVSEFFDMDHEAVLLNSLCKQANKDHWKFKIKDADGPKWTGFRECLFAKLLAVADKFLGAETHGDVDTMWAVLEKIMVKLANKTFSRHWFSEFHCSRNKLSFKFFGLELLIAKIVKKFGLGNLYSLILNSVKAHAFTDLVSLGEKSEVVLGHLLLVCKKYRKSKLHKSRVAEEASIRLAISKCMENFCFDKGSMIRSILDWLFHKVVLDYLIVDNELILEPEKIKLNVDKIMEGWTRKRAVSLVIPDFWAHQYAPLNYVQNCAFSGIIDAVSLSELLLVINGLPDGKAAGLSSIPNKLWKHSGIEVLGFLLRLLNACLVVGGVSGMSTQFSVFAVGSVDMHKAYDSVGWHHLEASLCQIKMCNRFIRFFGSIHNDRINRVMNDFSLTDGYRVCDRLDQDEVFLPLLWKIFYDSLLCEVKRHEHLCSYQIDTKLIARTDRIETNSRLFFFFAAGVFVDDTIWVSDCQTSMQYTLNITTRKGEAHKYLGIFLSTKELSKPSVTKAYSNVHFFVNMVLKKVITDKQFSYLVSAILQSIVNYRTQFSFVSLKVCHKWDAIIQKSLKSKTYLPRDFPVEAVHYPSLYGLKSFEQLQLECKLAAVVLFANASGILGHLFNYKFLDLQILSWAPMNPLQFPVKLCVSSVDNFLAGVVKIFLGNKLSLANNLPNAFCSPGVFPVSSVLGNSLYFSSAVE